MSGRGARQQPSQDARTTAGRDTSIPARAQEGTIVFSVSDEVDKLIQARSADEIYGLLGSVNED